MHLDRALLGLYGRFPCDGAGEDSIDCGGAVCCFSARRITMAQVSKVTYRFWPAPAIHLVIDSTTGADPLLTLENEPALVVSSKSSAPDQDFAPLLRDVINGQSLAKISPRLSVERGAHGADRLPDFPSLSTSGIRRSQTSASLPGDRGFDRDYRDLSDIVSLCFRRHLQRTAEAATGKKEALKVILSSACKFLYTPTVGFARGEVAFLL